MFVFMQKGLPHSFCAAAPDCQETSREVSEGPQAL